MIKKAIILMTLAWSIVLGLFVYFAIQKRELHSPKVHEMLNEQRQELIEERAKIVREHYSYINNDCLSCE